MLKKCMAFVLLLAFVAMTFNKAVIFIDFYLNQHAIEKALCVNKSRPQMHCHGQCQLTKKLAQTDEEEKTNPERSLENKYEVLSSKSFYTTSLMPVNALKLFQYTRFFVAQPKDQPAFFFHPPGC